MHVTVQMKGIKALLWAVVVSAVLPSLGSVSIETAAGSKGEVATFPGDTFTLKIPATEEMPAGSVIRLATLKLGMNSAQDAARMAKRVRIGAKVSALANGTGNQVTTDVHPTYNCLLQTYDFSDTPVDLVVGNAYPLSFLSDAYGTVMDGTRWYLRLTTDSFLTQSKTTTGYRIYAKLDGDLLAKPSQGVVVFDNVLPTADECAVFKSADWKGTVWLKNVTAATVGASYWQMALNEYGNVNSTVRLTGCEGYIYTDTVAPAVELIDEGTAPAWKFTAGGNGRVTTIAKLVGNGSFVNAYNNNHRIKFVDVSAFEGSITADGKFVEIGSGDVCATQGKVLVDADRTLLVADRKTLTAAAGVEVLGTLKGAGTIFGALTLSDGATLDLTDGLLTVSGVVSSGTGTVNVKLTSADVTTTPVALKLSQGTAMSVGTVLPCAVNPTFGGEPVTAALKLMVGSDGASLVLAPVGDGATIEVNVAESRKNLNNVAISGFTYRLTGIGGVLATSLSVAENGVLELDPIKTPLKIAAKPTLAGKIRLAAAYEGCTLGKFTLMTWVGDSLGLSGDALKALVDVGERDCAVEDVEAPSENAGCRQLVLKIGAYDTDAKTIRIMPLGDSITDGTSKNSAYECNPNYRVPLMQKLAARGYKPVTSGLRECAFNNRYATDAAGVIAPREYRWHAGVSGARVRTSYRADRGVNGGWREAIETTLDAAGDVDVITFKIGTNDAGDDKNLVFAGWTNVVWRILNARPNVKVVVTSILNMNGNDVWESGYNALIKAQAELDPSVEGAFPANRVFYVNLHDACPRTTDGVSNFTDVYHPNWIGHDRTSDEWVGGVERAIATMSFPTATDTFEKNTATGAESNVPEAYRVGYRHLATLALPKTAQGAALQNRQPTYTWTDATLGSDAKLSRIAYYLELKSRKTGHVRFVWTSLDAFGPNKTLAEMGLPTSYCKWGAVENLRVYSNDTGIHTTAADAEGISGRLQFTYGGVDAGGSVAGAPTQLAKWDWNDAAKLSGDQPTGGYGTMQVYRVFDPAETDRPSAETLFAFNRWSSGSGEATEVGIGNFAMHGAYAGGDTANGSINYMFTSGYETVDASAYELMNLEIWGVVEGGATVAPGDGPLEVTAESADQALTGVEVVIRDESAAAAGQANVVRLEAVPVAGADNRWAVSVVIDEEKMADIEETLMAFGQEGLLSVAAAETSTEVSIPADCVTAGLYYSILAASDARFAADVLETERVLARPNAPVVLSVPARPGTVSFFKMVANLVGK